MAQVKFFEKSLIDFDQLGVILTVTDATASNDGADFLTFLQNRNNDSFWATTDSDDAANTQIDIDLGGENALDRIILVKHNFKAFTIQYHDGTSYTDFSTAISETTNTDSTTEFTFDSVTIQLIRIIVTGTQVADADKELYQLLICKSLGQLTGYPQLKKPVSSLNKTEIKMLSGKRHVVRQRGFFSVDMSVANYNVSADMAIFESIYFGINGVLVWINAGDSTQFAREHIGYRGEDIYLMGPKDEYNPEFYKSYYRSGVKFKIKLVEVVR